MFDNYWQKATLNDRLSTMEAKIAALEGKTPPLPTAMASSNFGTSFGMSMAPSNFATPAPNQYVPTMAYRIDKNGKAHPYCPEPGAVWFLPTGERIEYRAVTFPGGPL